LTRIDYRETSSELRIAARKADTRFLAKSLGRLAKSSERKGTPRNRDSRNLREVLSRTGAKAERSEAGQSQALERFDRTRR